jgi:Xaa-Pro aminopeptidase
MTGSEQGNLLLLSESYHNAAMYYAIGFLFGDTVMYLRHDTGETLVCSNFERDEAARHSKIRDVLSPDDLGYTELTKQARDPHMAYAELVLRLLRRYGVHEVTVASVTLLHVVDHLRAAGISVTCDPAIFEDARQIKSAVEIAAIETAQRATERAIQQATEIVAACQVRNGVLVHEGSVLTSERLRAIVDASLLEQGCLGEGTIIACGVGAASPHNRGAGPLRANQPIVMDVFPRHATLRYFADMTRTVSKGDPGPEIRRMFDVTLRAQELALSLIRPGADGRAIYEAVCKLYEDAGYATFLRNGTLPASGFVHGLGHGVGLEIHEGPSLSRGNSILEAGHIVTVEPGLYDARYGGVRIEDLVLVTETGCRDLTQGEKRFVY